MKKAVLKDAGSAKRTPRQRAMLRLLDELGRSSRRDDTFWESFARDLKANRLTFRPAQNA
jgi:hypothetical protein